MTPIATSARPGGRSLAAYHRARALLYSVLVDVLDPSSGDLDRGELGARLAEIRPSFRAVGALVEAALMEPTAEEARQLLPRSAAWSQHRTRLKAFAKRSLECARALEEGDWAFAAEVWDEHTREIGGGAGRRLLEASDRLRDMGSPTLTRLGHALRSLVEEDIVFAALGPPSSSERLGAPGPRGWP
ncbi:MAG: hypothetical protein AAFZ18_06470 [Myxococcota bacterium]